MKNRLENLREVLLLNWKELAEYIGISRAMLDFIRAGTVEPSPKIIRKIIDAEKKAGILPKELPAPARALPTIRESPADAMPDYRDLAKKLDEILRRLDRLEKKWKG